MSNSSQAFQVHHRIVWVLLVREVELPSRAIANEDAVVMVSLQRYHRKFAQQSENVFSKVKLTFARSRIRQFSRFVMVDGP